MLHQQPFRRPQIQHALILQLFIIMKLPIILIALSSCLAHAQGGSLTPPPGSPAPTMKSLDQVEARTPLVEGATGVSITPGSSNITINQSGSYYLAGNLTVTSGNAISITADFVTLDLNGFTISSTANPASGNGILILASDVTVTNGNISGGYDIGEDSGPGFGTGIKSEEDGPIEINRIKVAGCAEDGIQLGNDFNKFNSVTSCFVRNIGNIGIVAITVEKCHVRNASEGGILCEDATRCQVTTVNGNGIEGVLIDNCRAHTTSGIGIKGATISYSIGSCHHGTGISGQLVSHCTGNSNFGNGHGIHATRVASFSQGSAEIIQGYRYVVAPIGIGCASGGGNMITNEFLMP